MNIQTIGENAGVIWRLLYGSNKRWEYQELKKEAGLSDRDLNAAIGWLAREDKLQFMTDQSQERDFVCFTLNHYIG